MVSALEEHLNLPTGTIKVYVLVEQLEATFQLMEIRAALGQVWQMRDGPLLRHELDN